MVSRPKPRRASPGDRSRLGLWAILVVGLLLTLYALAVFNTRPRVGGDRLRLDQFHALANSDGLRTARILDQDNYVVGLYRRQDATIAPYNVPFAGGGGHAGIVELLVGRQVETTVDHQFSKQLVQPATALLPALILVTVFVYLALSYRRGSGLFSVRSGARRVRSDHQAEVTFADVVGHDGAIAELREVRDILADPDRFRALGARVPKGVLLYGPPGCGKTLIARALAGESGAAFFSISGSDFVEMYVGVGAARVRDLFAEARADTPAIVFIDELDSVGRRRGGRSSGPSGGQDEQEQALNQILAEMDGFSPLEGILVVAATNRPDILDPALLRPGRFDRTVALERPDEDARRAILRRHLGHTVDAEVDLDLVARRAVGLSGADLANVANEAALHAARSGNLHITQEGLDLALGRVLDAPERQRRLSQRSRGFARSGTGGAQKVTFADIAGVDEAVAELAEVRDYLAEPARYAAMGARPPRGFLLQGPPGCGKTMLARAVAAESNAAFFGVAATEFVELFAGEGAGRVRDLFAEARGAAPAIVFIDELDAVGARRTVGGPGNREHDQTLNQILVELDGFDAGAGVTVLAATNRPDMLDPALVRPGRFDRRIHLDLPVRSARAAILALHARTIPLAPEVDLGGIAAMTQGYSGAELANLLNEAALLAARASGTGGTGGTGSVGMGDVREAFARLRGGVARAVALSPDELRKVAYHEMGHALVGRALAGARRPEIVSVVARGRALGATWESDDFDRLVYSRSDLIDQMAAALGGRVAEELVFGEPASTSADDLRRVTEIAWRMVCELGMGQGLSPRSYTASAYTVNGTGDGSPTSESMARVIDDEVSRLVDEAALRARGVLAPARSTLDAAAQALLVQETVSAAELEAIVAMPSASLAVGLPPT